MNRKLVRRAANKLEYEQLKLQWEPFWPAVNQPIQQKIHKPRLYIVCKNLWLQIMKSAYINLKIIGPCIILIVE